MRRFLSGDQKQQVTSLQDQRTPASHHPSGVPPANDDKHHQKYLAPPSGYPCFGPVNTLAADPGFFPGKTGSRFPGMEPPLFFDRNAPPGIGEVPINLRISRFFTITGRPLNCTVFSCLKRPFSKNNDLYQ